VVDERMTARLAQLKDELRKGEAQLRDLMQQEAALRETLLRISGAVQVLEEVLQEERDEADAPGSPAAGEDQPRIVSVP
jgi:ABC-type transporter Mla subunit MlaD